MSWNATAGSYVRTNNFSRKSQYILQLRTFLYQRIDYCKGRHGTTRRHNSPDLTACDLSLQEGNRTNLCVSQNVLDLYQMKKLIKRSFQSLCEHPTACMYLVPQQCERCIEQNSIGLKNYLKPCIFLWLRFLSIFCYIKQTNKTLWVTFERGKWHLIRHIFLFWLLYPKLYLVRPKS